MQSTVAAAPVNMPAGSSDTHAGKYLVFALGREEFAIEVMKVREIMGLQDITAVPRTPSHVKGVINLRGKVIPVMDLRVKFALPQAEYSPRTCIIVVHAGGGSAAMLVGIVVDGVAEVLNLAAGDIEATPDFGQGVALPYLLGMAKIKGKVKILLDIDQVLMSQEVQRLDGLVQ